LQNKTHPVFSTQSVSHVARAGATELAPNSAVIVVMSTEEVELSIRGVVKGYHLPRFQVNVGERFTASKKKRERGNAF